MHTQESEGLVNVKLTQPETIFPGAVAQNWSLPFKAEGHILIKVGGTPTMKIDLGSFWQALRCRARLLIIILDDLRSHLPPSTSDPRQTHLNFILYIPFSSEPTCQVEILRTKSWIWMDFINHLSKTLIRMRKTMFSYAFPVLCWGLDAQTKKSNSVLSIRICPSALSKTKRS